MNETRETTPVVVNDFNMPFGSMVGFMVKWAIASIPAAIILLFVAIVFGGLLKGCIGT